MKKILIILLFITSISYSQIEGTDRPSVSDSNLTIKKGSFQTEIGYSITNEITFISLRFGVLKNIDIRLSIPSEDFPDFNTSYFSTRLRLNKNFTILGETNLNGKFNSSNFKLIYSYNLNENHSIFSNINYNNIINYNTGSYSLGYSFSNKNGGIVLETYNLDILKFKNNLGGLFGFYFIIMNKFQIDFNFSYSEIEKFNNQIGLTLNFN